MKKYRMGIIGPGAFGQFCIKIYQAIPNLEVAAIADNNEAVLENVSKKYDITIKYNNWQDLVQDKSIDIVGIFTPPFTHGEIALACAKIKKPFLVEKPLATDLEMAEKIAAETQKNDVPATLNYVMRYAENYQRVADLVKSGRFGKLRRMLFENYASQEGLRDNHWLWDKEKSGGLLVEHGVHFFDIFNAIIQEKPDEAKSYIASSHEAYAIVKYPNEILATFYHLFDKITISERNFAVFVFDNGYARIKGWIPMELELEWLECDKMKQEIFKINESKGEYYQKLVKAVIEDLIRQIEDRSYRGRITLGDGRDSLAIALEAREHPIFK